MTAAESVNEEAVEAAAKAMIALTGIEPDDADMDEAKAVARAALAAAVPHLERRIRESIAGEIEAFGVTYSKYAGGKRADAMQALRRDIAAVVRSSS